MNQSTEEQQANASALPLPDNKTRIAHRVALTGYFGLLLLIPIWNLWWYPLQIASAKIITLVWLLPLIFPLWGMLKGRAYTHAWSGFIAVIYVCHALASFVTSLNEWPAIVIELILASAFLFGGMYFAKWRGEQLGLQLPKQK